MRPLAAIVLLVLGSLVTAPAASANAQTAYGISQAKLDAPGLDGDGLVVAVVDTGVDASSPSVAGRVIQTVDLSPPPQQSCPDFGHGTWVASVIAGAETAQVPAGVAPEADIVSVKVVNNCHQSSLQHIADGLDWVTDHADEYGIDVVNLSIGDPTPSGPETDAAEAAADRAVEAGLVVVTAAGNAPGLGMVATPASADRVITIGSMTDPFTPDGLDGPGFRPPPWTSSGPTADGRVKPDVMAPSAHVGVGTGGGASARAGTSGAAAFVSGLALLMLDVNPALGPDDIKDDLMSTAEDWGRPGLDEDYGAGRLDAYSALVAAGAPLLTPPSPVPHRTFPGRAAPGAPVVHEVVVTDPDTPLAATLFPDPPDRLPDAPAAELELRVQGPGVDETASTDYRRRSVAVAAPVPGTYTLTVSATGAANTYELDVSGPLDAAAAAPALALDAPPAATNDPTPAFAGSAAGATGVVTRIYRRGLQVRSLWSVPAGGRWSAAPGVALPDGTYAVGAEHGAGGIPTRTARTTFRIDTAAPDTTIEQHGSSFALGTSEPGSRFECSHDGGPWTACTSPVSRVGDAAGKHTLAARAVDEAGNADPTPATASWTVAPPPKDPVGPSSSSDTQGPAVTLARAVTRRLAPLRSGGLQLRLRCDDACALSVELRVSSRVARKLKLPARLARANGLLAAPGDDAVRLRPSRASRARLKRLRKLNVTLVVVATDAAGNQGRLKLPLKLR